jgi:hypothetical protein
VPGVDVQEGEGQGGGGEGLLGDVQHDGRVFAAREQQDRPRELGDDLAHDEDRLGF